MKCTFTGCDKPTKAHSLCNGHYAQQKLGHKLAPLKHKSKKIDNCINCGKPVYSKGYCRNHYEKYRRWGKTLTPPPYENPNLLKQCIYENCERNRSGNIEYCKAHRNQLYRANKTQPINIYNQTYKDNEGRICTKCNKYYPYTEYYKRAPSQHKNNIWSQYQEQCKKCCLSR